MKKKISTLLIMIMSFAVLALTGCNKAEDGTGDSSQSAAPAIESAMDFYTEVWAAFGEDNKFPCVGGDVENSTEGPGQFQLTENNADSFKQLLLVTDELYDMLEDDVATLHHMMKTNTVS